MNQEQMLIMVEAAITTRPESKNGKWYLLIEHNQIRCEPVRELPLSPGLITVFDEDEATKGFTPYRWNQIKCRITNRIKI